MKRTAINLNSSIGRSIHTRMVISSISLSMKRSIGPVVRKGIRPSVHRKDNRFCPTCDQKMKIYRCSLTCNPWIYVCSSCV